MLKNSSHRFHVNSEKLPVPLAKRRVTFGLMPVSHLNLYAEGENHLTLQLPSGILRELYVDMRVANDFMHADTENAIALVEKDTHDRAFVHLLYPKDSLRPSYFSMEISVREAETLLQDSDAKILHKQVYDVDYAGHQWNIHRYAIPKADPILLAEPQTNALLSYLEAAPVWLGPSASHNPILTDYGILQSLAIPNFRPAKRRSRPLLQPRP